MPKRKMWAIQDPVSKKVVTRLFWLDPDVTKTYWVIQYWAAIRFPRKSDAGFIASVLGELTGIRGNVVEYDFDHEDAAGRR